MFIEEGMVCGKFGFRLGERGRLCGELDVGFVGRVLELLFIRKF